MFSISFPKAPFRTWYSWRSLGVYFSTKALNVPNKSLWCGKSPRRSVRCKRQHVYQYWISISMGWSSTTSLLLREKVKSIFFLMNDSSSHVFLVASTTRILCSSSETPSCSFECSWTWITLPCLTLFKVYLVVSICLSFLLTKISLQPGSHSFA